MACGLPARKGDHHIHHVRVGGKGDMFYCHCGKWEVTNVQIDVSASMVGAMLKGIEIGIEYGEHLDSGELPDRGELT